MTGASEGWGVGDLAVCLGSEGWWNVRSSEARPGPAQSEVIRVRAVWRLRDDEDQFRGMGLEFDEYPDEVYAPHHFRKIEPDHSAADDAEIVALIKGASVRARA